MKTDGDPAFLKANAHLVYPFFLVHMLGFGLTGFYMAYGDTGSHIIGLYLFNGFALYVYIAFYLAIFGLDTVKWIFINSLLGLFGIYAELNFLLSIFGKTASDYSNARHFIPFLYYILYTFLIRRAIIDLTKASEDEAKKNTIERLYILISIVVYSGLSYFQFVN